MKRIFILAIAAVATTTMMISCGQGSAKLTTDTDSLNYAIGVDLGTMSFEFDSTLNPDIITAAIKDVYAKNNKMTREEAGAFIQEYITITLPLKKSKEATTEAKKFLEEAISDGADTLASGLAYKITEAGSDVKVALGDSVSVNYVLTLPNGTLIDQSPEGTPVSFLLQTGQLVEAWLEGVPLVGEGGKITLFVPSALGYGEGGTQGIPPHQALKFEVEVVKVTKAVAPATK